jgi:predicted ArsR family transcriptional regulator
MATLNNPLEQLLNLLASGRPYSLDDLARSLDMDSALLRQMLAQLEQAGYLRSPEPLCERGACAHCHQAAACGLARSQQMWLVTDRGWRAARRATA